MITTAYDWSLEPVMWNYRNSRDERKYYMHAVYKCKFDGFNLVIEEDS